MSQYRNACHFQTRAVEEKSDLDAGNLVVIEPRVDVIWLNFGLVVACYDSSIVGLRKSSVVLRQKGIHACHIIVEAGGDG